MTSNRLIILDRDGVINRDSEDYVKNVAEWQPLPGAIEAIGRLYQAGYQVAVATNQAGIGRGIIQPADLQAMHAHMQEMIKAAGGQLAALEYCPHHPNDGCDCRKPAAGMLLKIAAQLGLNDLSSAWMVGDSLRDLQAGEAAGTRVALLLTGNGKTTRNRLDQLQAPHKVAVFDSLAAFADHLLTVS